MIFDGQFVPGIDLADVLLWAFFIFFGALIFYLQQEGRREGYPLESDTTGEVEKMEGFWFPPAKTFHLPHGRGDVTVPPGPRDNRVHKLKRTGKTDGSAYEPIGDPMTAEVGPGSYAERADVPDLTDDGRPRIVPFARASEYSVAEQDADPRGMTVYGCDKKPAGVVADLWVDQSEAVVRYMDVDLGEAGGHRRVILPVPFARIDGGRKAVFVHAIKAEHFAGVPALKSSSEITRLEEDKVSAYYGAGKLYATPDRLEPLL